MACKFICVCGATVCRVEHYIFLYIYIYIYTLYILRALYILICIYIHTYTLHTYTCIYLRALYILIYIYKHTYIYLHNNINVMTIYVLKWCSSVMSDSLWPHGLQPTRLLHPWNFPGKSIRVGCHFLLQGIFLTQGSNPGLPRCRQTLYHLSHQGSPYMSAVQFSSVTQSYLTLRNPMNCSTPGLPVHHQLPEFSLKLLSIELVMPSSHLILCRPLLLLPPIPPSIRVFSSENSLHEVAKVLEFQL